VATFGQWRYSCDVAATVAAYQRAATGDWGICSCSGCRNFAVARPSVFPSPFLLLLNTLGIDPSMEGEIYHVYRVSPGKHNYGGWFHFVGVLEEPSDFPPVKLDDTFSTWMRQYQGAPCLKSLKGLPLVQLEIDAMAVTWCLDEEELE
jgi:hypothetical protein